MNSDKCSICLQINKLVVSVHNFDKHNVAWLTKLQFLIPELEWSEEYVICNNCSKQLNIAWKFKRSVVHLEKKRRKEQSIILDVGNDNAEDNCGTGYMYIKDNTNDEKKRDIFNCYNCSKSFTTKKSLLYHFENEHKVDGAQDNKSVLANHMKEENDIFIPSEDNLSGGQLIGFNNKQISKYETCLEENINETTQESFSHCCEKCSIRFPSFQELDLHNVSEHTPSKSTEESLVLRKRRGRKPLRKYNCEICNEKFGYVKLLVEHCVSVHGMEAKIIKPYSCEKCEMRFVSSANLDQHIQYHNKNRTHICSSCGKAFITKSDLTVHEYTHSNRRNYKCTVCDKAFNTNNNLRTHNLVVHTDSSLWKYVCSICEKRFPLKTNYDQHFRRHTGEKEYTCHICKKPFISKSELQRHIHIHSNIKAFKCITCDKEYKERRTYQQHLAKKHGIGNAKITVREKKFVCHICPSQFYDKQKLMRHICSHSGLKPFSCYVCDKKFTRKSYLKHHLRTAHNIEEQLSSDMCNDYNI